MTSSQANVAGVEGRGASCRSAVPTLGSAAGIVLLLWISLLVLGRFFDFSLPGTWFGRAAIAVPAAVAAMAVWKWRRVFLVWLTAIPFAVALIAALLLATVLGTVVLQGVSPAEFTSKYGAFGAGALRLVDGHDIFHSASYRGFLAILSVSLVAVMLRRRFWRPQQWGFLLSHGGVVLILIGGLIGSAYGAKGFFGLREGEVVRSFSLRDGKGTLPLGFGLRLDKFEVDRYPAEFRLYAYRKEGREYKVISSVLPEEAGDWREIGASGDLFRVRKTYPDFRMRTELRETADGGGHPALQLKMAGCGTEEGRLILLSGVPKRDVLDFGPRGALVRFVWEPGDAEAPSFSDPAPERHLVSFDLKDGESEEVEVLPGKTYPVGGGEYELNVVSFYPDFVYDVKDREAKSRSNNPANPALKVRLRSSNPGSWKEHFLFAKAAGYRGAHGGERGGKLTYRYVAASPGKEREIVVVGRTREVLEYFRGELKERRALDTGSDKPLAEGVPAGCELLLADAKEVPVPESRSDKWRRPAVEIEWKSAGKTAEKILAADSADTVPASDRETVLVYHRKPDDIRAFRSRVSVLEGDEKVLGTAIEVNHPLSYGGTKLYQSDYRKEDLTYSGILVVRDPGLPAVYLGFVMICLGVIFIFYIRPILRRRAAAARARAGVVEE